MTTLLAEARKQSLHQQRAISTAVGLSRSGYAMLEQGHRRPSVEVLWRLTVELQLSPTDLVRVLGDLVDAPAHEVEGVLARRAVLDPVRGAA